MQLLAGVHLGHVLDLKHTRNTFSFVNDRSLNFILRNGLDCSLSFVSNQLRRMMLTMWQGSVWLKMSSRYFHSQFCAPLVIRMYLQHGRHFSL